MKLLIGSICVIVFGCFNSIVSGTHFAVLEGNRNQHEFATESTMWIDQQYFEDNKETMFSQCDNKIPYFYYIKDKLARLKINCIDIAIVNSFNENGWKVEYHGSFDNKLGNRVSNWYMRKDD